MIRDASLAHAVHYVFEWAALAAGTLFYRRAKLRQGNTGLTHGTAFPVALGCLIGAAFGNKAVYWLENPHLWASAANSPDLWLQGQSIVGGLLGGWAGVECAKWVSRWQGPRTGDDFVPAILVGILIGRIGCFLAGLHDGTFGLATTVPWGIDLGDGTPRHPAPLYEWLAALLALLTWPSWRSAMSHTPGLSFRVFMLGYMIWRVAIDSIKPVPYAYAFGWSGIQWLSALAALLIAVGLGHDKLKGKKLAPVQFTR